MKAGQVIVLCLIVALVGIAATYGYMKGEELAAYQKGYTAGYAAGQTAVPTVEPVSLKITQTGGSTFDISANVSSDGSSTAKDLKLALTIENTDNKTAKITITAKNPKTGEEGLPSGLENAYFNVYVGDDVKKYLFTDSDYTAGKSITLEADSVLTTYIGVELEQAPAGTFADNQTYTMDIFIYQPDANYVQEISYTVKT